MFDPNDYVRCYNLTVPAQVALALKAWAKEVGMKIAIVQLDELVQDLRKEGLLKGNKACWVGLDDVGRPRGPVLSARKTIVSMCGDPTRYYENDCEVLIRQIDGSVYAKPDDLY